MKTRLLLLLLVISGYAFGQVPSGAEVEYLFTNGSLVNSINSGTNDMVLDDNTAVAATDRFGNVNNSLLLNTDKLFSGNVNVGAVKEVTVSFWVKLESNPTANRQIILIDGGGSSRNLVLSYVSAGNPNPQLTLEVNYRNAVNFSPQTFGGDTSITNLFDDNWHHIVFRTQEASQGLNYLFQGFVDGVNITNWTGFMSGNGSNNTLEWVQNPRFIISNGVNDFNQEFDDLRFYNRSLTNTEISNLFSETQSLVYIPDANFKSELLANTMINTNGNTEIDISEAINYTSDISVSNKNISDATGIQSFVNITSVDFSNNLLVTADLSSNSALTSINVSNNNLTELNIQNGTNTNITMYDSRFNPNLLCVKVDNAVYATNNFTNIDTQTTFNLSCAIPVYVDLLATTGTNDGSSWANAYTNLNTALVNNPNREFWVKAGTYNPGASRGDSFTLGANQEIYGGFNGTETNLSQRNPRVNLTILSGDVNANDAGTFNPSDANRSENNHRIITVNGANVVIDGFEITSANANGSSSALQEGSGVSINGTYNVTINNCQFTKHTLNRAGIIRALDNSGNYNITVNKTIFKDNQSSFATCYYGRSSGGVINLKFENSLFTNNTATTTSAASAIWLRQDTSGFQNLNIVNTTFSNNTLNSATPVISYLGSVPLVNIYNSIFWNNTNGSGTNVDAIQAGTTGAKSNNISNNGFSAYSSASNISTSDPQFVGPTNFRLTSASPGKDLGDNNFIPAGITKDLDGNERVFNSTVDIGAYEYGATLSTTSFVKNDSFKIYPNPVTETLNISTEKDIKSVVVYTVLGSKVLTAKGNTINVSALEHGVYMIKITDTSNQQITKRFIKQ